MPSVLTHYGFNKEVLDYNIEFLKGNEDIYLVGAQGPDPFLFYGIIPFMGSRNGDEIRKYGTKLHKINPSKVFEMLMKYASNSKDKNILYSYILGAGLHYILDRKIHPYVFYKTGFSDDKKMKKKYFVDHTLFETNLDVLLINDRYKKYKVKPIDAISCEVYKIEKVSEMYNKVSNDKAINDNTFKDSYNHMCKIENILYSKTGKKKKLVKLLFKNTPFNTMMHSIFVEDDEKIDYLNIKNNNWLDPSSEVVYQKSLYDLLNEAKEESYAWFKLVIDSYNGKEIDLEGFTKGFIYDGYKEGNKMKVFKSVYREGEEINDN